MLVEYYAVFHTTKVALDKIGKSYEKDTFVRTSVKY